MTDRPDPRDRGAPADSDSRNRGDSRARLVVDLLDSYSTWVGLGVFALALGFIAVVATRGVPAVPRYWRVFLVAAVACAAFGYAPVVKVLRYLYDPPRRFLVQAAVSEDDGGIWRLTPAAFEELDVRGGQLYEWPGTEYPTYGVQWYDPDRNVCKATWRGSASDEELLESQEKIDEMREELDEKAKERDILLVRAQTLVREAVFEHARLVVQEYNRASVVDMSSLSQKIEETLGNVDLADALNDQSVQKTDPETASEPESVAQPTRTPEAAPDGGEVDDV